MIPELWYKSLPERCFQLFFVPLLKLVKYPLCLKPHFNLAYLHKSEHFIVFYCIICAGQKCGSHFDDLCGIYFSNTPFCPSKVCAQIITWLDIYEWENKIDVSVNSQFWNDNWFVNWKYLNFNFFQIIMLIFIMVKVEGVYSWAKQAYFL